MSEIESRHVEWQSGVMDQIAVLSGGGLVASASLLWPQAAALPNKWVIAVAWAALGLATVAAVASNYLSATGNAFRILHAHQEDVLPMLAAGGGRETLEDWIAGNRKKASRRTKVAYPMGIAAPWLFSTGVLLLAVWAILSLIA